MIYTHSYILKRETSHFFRPKNAVNHLQKQTDRQPLFQEGLNGVMAFTANGLNFGHFTANG